MNERTELDIVNLALSRCRRGPVSSLADGSPEAAQAALWYTQTRDALLQANRWKFACVVVESPTELADTPLPGYEKVWLVPPATDHVMRVFDAENRDRAYRIVGDRIHVEVGYSTGFEYYSKDVPPSRYSALFVQALVGALAMNLAPAFDLEVSRWRGLGEMAAAELQRARLVDSQSGTAEAVDMYRLNRVHGGFGSSLERGGRSNG